MTRTIYRPSAVILTAVDKRVSFVPYKESFTYTIEEGDSVQFEVEKAEEIFYYLMQESDNLKVEYVASNSEVGNDVVYTTVTITNNGERDFHFVPFNQNFGFTVKAGDTLIFEIPVDIKVGDYTYHVADYYKNLAYGDVTVDVEDRETAELDAIVINCGVDVYHLENGSYKKVLEIRDTVDGSTSYDEDGYVVYVGDKYKFVVVIDGGKTIELLRCNGEDIAKATTVEQATELTATEEGFSVIAIATDSGSSSSFID